MEKRGLSKDIRLRRARRKPPLRWVLFLEKAGLQESSRVWTIEKQVEPDPGYPSGEMGRRPPQFGLFSEDVCQPGKDE
jgi:hypothetical protein